MNIWAIADLHLAFGAPEKSMEIFGPRWKDYATRIKQEWINVVHPEDLVLIAGDISWAKTLDQAQADLQWIDALPGIKVMIRGNHDYWWSSAAKVRRNLPSSIHIIQNDTFNIQEISIGGTRLWDTTEYYFGIHRELSAEQLQEQQKIFNRELERLELSLKGLRQEASIRIAMTHYPPIGIDLKSSTVSHLLEQYNVTFCLFGHLHNMPLKTPFFGEKNGVTYHLTSSDYLEFHPLKVYSRAGGSC